jgi:hypothetical protein
MSTHLTRGRAVRPLAWTLLLALLGVAPALAQLSTARVEVQVTDAQGGALPCVTVALENVDTGKAFNVFNTTNYDVNSIDGAEFLSGPTPANPALAAVRNPNFGRARATLPGHEIQLGLRWEF